MHLPTNPQLLVQKDTAKNWMLKVRPLKLKGKLKNLLHANMIRQWNQAVNDRLLATLTMAEFQVLQDQER
jgi:glycine cleavage system H lipoate-binding protein